MGLMVLLVHLGVTRVLGPRFCIMTDRACVFAETRPT